MKSTAPLTVSRFSRTLFRLDEAASRVGCSPADLLSAAADGALELCAEVPAGVLIFCTAGDVEFSNYARFGRYGGPPPELEAAQLMEEVKYIILSPDDCSKVLSLGTHRQTVFQFAGMLNAANEIVRIPKPERNAKRQRIGGLPFLNIFRACDHTASTARVALAKDLPPCPIHLHEELLLVTASELDQYQSSAESGEISLFPVGEHTSEKLQVIYRAASRWAFALRKASLRGDEDFHQTHKAVTTDLLSKTCFKGRKTLALAAASLVRPIVARRERRGYAEELQAITRQGTPEVRALHIASQLWVPFVQGRGAAPTNTDVVAALELAMKNEGAPFVGLLAEHGPKILRPEVAEDGRHKQTGSKK